MKFKNLINIPEVIILLTAFVFFTIIGTVSHEFSHYYIAKQFGLDPVMHFGHVDYLTNRKNYDANFTEKMDFFITIAGPLQTIFVGLIGFVFLLSRKKVSIKFNCIDWTAVLFSFFWSREILNLITYFYNLNNNIKRKNIGDEEWISLYLNLQPSFLNILLGIIGLLICLYVVFFILPKKSIINFIIGGFLGSLLGYFIWFKIIGKYILP